MNVTPTACKVCGSTDTVLWHRFIHEPQLRLAPEGILYRGEVFYLCDRCMAGMIDTALSIRKAKDGMLTAKKEMDDYFKIRMDLLNRDVSDAAKNIDLPDFYRSVIKRKEDTEDEKPKEDTGDEM